MTLLERAIWIERLKLDDFKMEFILNTLAVLEDANLPSIKLEIDWDQLLVDMNVQPPKRRRSAKMAPAT